MYPACSSHTLTNPKQNKQLWYLRLSSLARLRLFNQASAEPTKAAARALFEPTFDYLAKKLGSSDYLVGNRFTVADAYLVTMLNWALFLKVDLAKWPTIAAYHQKHLKRPSVVQAMGVEMAERQRRAA